MKRYYKGVLFNPSLESKSIQLGYVNTNEYGQNKININESFFNRGFYVDYLRSVYNNEEFVKNKALVDDEFKNEIVKYSYFNFDFSYFYQKQKDRVSNLTQIIYEEFTDENGNLYGKEINTGIIFPIYCKTNFDDISLFLEKREYSDLDDIFIHAKPISSMKCVDEVGSAIVKEKVATKEDIEEYNRSSKDKEFISQSKKNAFNREVNLVSSYEYDLSEELKLINSINLILASIKCIDIELYNKYKHKYDLIIENYNTNNTNNPVSVVDLRELYDYLLFRYYFYNSNGKYIILDKLKEETNSVDLDKLLNILLKYINDFELKEQKKLLDILCELFIIYNDLDSDSEFDYSNTKFNELRETIEAKLLERNNKKNRFGLFYRFLGK